MKNGFLRRFDTNSYSINSVFFSRLSFHRQLSDIILSLLLHEKINKYANVQDDKEEEIVETCLIDNNQSQLLIMKN